MSLNKPASTQSIYPLIFPPMQSTDADIPLDMIWRFYSHLIQRNPKDLQSHTRRIFLAMQYKNAAFLSGSLQDLFLILKNAGKQLRIRLLKASAPYLEKNEVIHFAIWIKSEEEMKVENSYGYNWTPGSMLSKGLLEPDNTLVTEHKTQRKNKPLSAIEEAQSFIEYGQLDLAKKTLEEAIAIDKNNLALKNELNNLLQYMNKDDKEKTNHAASR